MSTFLVTGSVDTISIRGDDSTWHGFVEVPKFRVTADSPEEAAQLARAIIDPLEMTGVNVSVTEEVDVAQLTADLDGLAGATLTPYEHYCEAERLLAEVEREGSYGQNTLDRAKVHAALACAAIPERGGR